MKQLVSALWQSTMEKWRMVVWAESTGGVSRHAAARVQGHDELGGTSKKRNWPTDGQDCDEGENKPASAVVTRYKEDGIWD